MIHLLSILLASAPLLVQDGERRPVFTPTPATDIAGTVDAELRLYDVAHLTGYERLEELVSEVLRTGQALASATVRERIEMVQVLRDHVESTTESVSLAVIDMLEPPFDESVHSITHLVGGTLAVIASAEQHAWITEFFERVSGFGGMVDVQARIYKLKEGQFAELSRHKSGEVLSGPEAEALMQGLLRLDSEVVLAPHLIVHPFQRSDLSVITQVAYIQDYDLKVLGDVEIVDPIIGVAESGVQLRVRCVPLADGKLSIDADLDYSTLADPIKTFKTTFGGAMPHEVTVQLPEITIVRLHGRFEMRPGETLLMVTRDPSLEYEILVLVRATRVETQEK